MTRITCIIFDLDGTLSQTNDLIFATFNHVAEKYLGKVFAPAEITKMFGPPEDIAIRRLVGKEHLDEAMTDFYSYYEAHHPRLASIYDGVRAMLEYLKQRGVILAIFTGKGTRSTSITLEQIGIKQYFDLIVTGHDVANHKPSAEGIRKIVSRFDLDPAEVLMVGDSVGDVQAAREAGVQIAAVLWDSYAKEKVLQMDVDYSFHSVDQFSSWLQTVIPIQKGVDS